jgi:hypothetical protein
MSLTPYQLQFKRRMKRAISLRAKADRKARRYTQLLADAIGAAENAATQMNALNQLYNVDVSTYTLLTQKPARQRGQQRCGSFGQSAPGERCAVHPGADGKREWRSRPIRRMYGE